MTRGNDTNTILISVSALQMQIRELCELARKDKETAALELLKKEKRFENAINQIYELLTLPSNEVMPWICEI